MSKVKVLFVCLGNICRSPLAEAIFLHKVRDKGLAHRFLADSCGTSNYHIGDRPDLRTIASAHRNGIKIEHYCRQLTADDLREFDFVLAMDQSNHRNILRLATEEDHQKKVFMLRDFTNPGKGDEVPDPYYGDENAFQEVFEILEESVEAFLNHLGKNTLQEK